MAKVGLEGMQFYAFHGYYDFERRVGNQFSVDVILDLDIQGDPEEKITNTINYEIIHQTCKKYMKKRYRLLESLAYDIANDLKKGDDIINNVKVRIEKLNPNMEGKIGNALVEIVLD